MVFLQDINTVPFRGFWVSTTVKVCPTVRLQPWAGVFDLGTRSLTLFEPGRIHKLNCNDHNAIKPAFDQI